MSESLDGVKSLLEEILSALEGSQAGGLSEEELKACVDGVREAHEALVRNDRKIWLRTKKGREMLFTVSEAAEVVRIAVEAGTGFEGALVALKDKMKQLEEEIRKRSMVVT